MGEEMGEPSEVMRVVLTLLMGGLEGAIAGGVEEMLNGGLDGVLRRWWKTYVREREREEEGREEERWIGEFFEMERVVRRELLGEREVEWW